MHTLNHTLDRRVAEADGRYLNAQELKPLEQFIQSYATRLEAYEHIRDQSPKMVQMSLQKWGHAHPDLVAKHASRCQYDMAEVLRYVALSILRDDETFFMEQMMSWLDTILLAYRRTAHCAVAYRYLQEAANSILPNHTSTLMRPYLDSVITALQSHA